MELNEEEPEEEADFEMDGSPHFVPGRESCHCASFGVACPKCGGFAHYQPVYGGFYYRCEKCGYEWT